MSMPRVIGIPSWVPRAIWSGLIQWAGEAAVGLIPWLAYVLTYNLSASPYITALCDPSVLYNQYNYFSKNCRVLPDSPAQEICILAVVISGLSLLSIAQFAPGRRRSEKTALTYLMLILSIGALLAGALLYAFISNHLDVGPGWPPYLALACALTSSFVLALQEAVLNFRPKDKTPLRAPEDTV
jgi:hypothetical protein